MYWLDNHPVTYYTYLLHAPCWERHGRYCWLEEIFTPIPFKSAIELCALCPYTHCSLTLSLSHFLSMDLQGSFSLFAEIGMSILLPLTPEVWNALAFIVDMTTVVIFITLHWGLYTSFRHGSRFNDSIVQWELLTIFPLSCSSSLLSKCICLLILLTGSPGVGCLSFYFELNYASSCKCVLERNRGRWTWHAVAVPATLSWGHRGHDASAGVPDSAAQSLSQLSTTTWNTHCFILFFAGYQWIIKNLKYNS